jgi:hypothetical protein
MKFGLSPCKKYRLMVSEGMNRREYWDTKEEAVDRNEMRNEEVYKLCSSPDEEEPC